MTSSLLRIPADFVRGLEWIDADFDYSDTNEIMWWVKYNELEYWMQERYNSLGGIDKNFEEKPLRLWEHDFDRLVKDLKNPDQAAWFLGFLDSADFGKWAYFFIRGVR